MSPIENIEIGNPRGFTLSRPTEKEPSITTEREARAREILDLLSADLKQRNVDRHEPRQPEDPIAVVTITVVKAPGRSAPAFNEAQSYVESIRGDVRTVIRLDDLRDNSPWSDKQISFRSRKDPEDKNKAYVLITAYERDK